MAAALGVSKGTVWGDEAAVPKTGQDDDDEVLDAEVVEDSVGGSNDPTEADDTPPPLRQALEKALKDSVGATNVTPTDIDGTLLRRGSRRPSPRSRPPGTTLD